MLTATLPDNPIERDNEGYLLNPEDWTEALADQLAHEENVELSDEHREIVMFVRNYFLENEKVPETRAALKYMKQNWGSERATRKYLYGLFPHGYAQQACKYAGMRKPLKLMLDV